MLKKDTLTHWKEVDYGHFFGCWEHEDPSWCDDLIEFHSRCDYIEKMSGTVYDTRVGKGIIDKTRKNSLDLSVPLQISDPAIVHYRNLLQECFYLYTVKFPAADATSPWMMTEPFNIQYYPAGGGFFTWHSERTTGSAPAVYRHLVFMTYLNTVEDGGETEFFHQNVKIKPIKGHTLIWPADWTYRHRGIPAPTQEKYIATGWTSLQ